MRAYTINKQRYHLKSDWKDLTLEEAMYIRAVELPEVSDWFDWYKHWDQVKALVGKFTDAPLDVVPPQQVMYWFLNDALPVWTALRSPVPAINVRFIETFTHEGIEYRMPERLELGQDVVLQHSQDVKRFVEASNLLKAYSEMRIEGIKAMPFFIAVVVREANEVDFDEARVAARAERFKTLPMDIVWEVFFCTSQLLHRLMIDTLQSLTARKPTRAERMQARLDSRLGRLRSLRAELRGILTGSTE